MDHINYLLDRMIGMLLHKLADAATDHSLLSEQKEGLTTKSLTNISNLLGADVLNIHDEQLGVVLEDLVELGEVQLLLLSSRHLSLHCTLSVLNYH